MRADVTAVLRGPAGAGRVAAGELDRVTDDIAAVTGHPATALADLPLG